MNTNNNEGEDTHVSTDIFLKLGDIILIEDPTNETLHNNVFLVEYIDPHKMKLIHSETFDKIVLPISSEGIVGDGNIQTITIISSNPHDGYARQHDLLPGTWINIYFGGDIPTVITGKITNLEEDMIEITTTEQDTLFINFAYQGIPEHLPIDMFEIRPAVQEMEEKVTNQEKVTDEERAIDEEKVTDEERAIDEEKDQYEVEEGLPIEGNLVKPAIKPANKNVTFFDLNDIEFGDVINVNEYVTVDRDKFRFNLEAQTNDLLEEMTSSIPTHKRSHHVLNNIHLMITRFLQLREISSTFDKNKNITGIIKRTSEDRPLAEYLAQFKNELYWIMLVVKNVKKVYVRLGTENARFQGQEDDYDRITQTTDIREMQSLYMIGKDNINTRYVGNNHSRKYSSYTYQSIDSYMTPFYGTTSDIEPDIFTNPNGIIVEGNVETDVHAIVDNLGDMYSSAFKQQSSTNDTVIFLPNVQRFVIQKYNLASEKLDADTFKGQHLIAHRVKVGSNDPISIKSILTLPEPTVRFSQINLPGTNLLVRSNLNLHFLNYWQLLKRQTDITKITIDGLDNEMEYNERNFVDNIKQYMLDLTSYQRPSNITNGEVYKIFLKTIIPKTRVLFSLVKKYIKGRLSLVDVVNYLEPFMIYPANLTYMQYREINKFIYDKIKEYNAQFKEYSMLFSSLRYTKYQPKNKGYIASGYAFQNPLFELLTVQTNSNFKREIMDLYGYDDFMKLNLSGSEFLKNVILADGGNLFHTAVSFTNLELMFPKNLSEIFEKDNGRMKEIIEKDKQNQPCATFVIAKKYYSAEHLLRDNGLPIYYDKDFDTTNYSIIDEKYKKEYHSMTNEAFLAFLIEKLKTTYKLNASSAEYMAETLLNQAKKVREGDYALLVTSETGEIMADQMEYYVRRNETWVLDKEVDPNTFIQDDDVLCNINYQCMYDANKQESDKCVSTELTKDNIIQKTLKDILDQFDKKYEISQADLNTQINKQIVHHKSRFERLQMLKYNASMQHNKYQYEMGLTVEDEIKDRKISPHIKLRDLILGQTDLVKRQHDIVHFASRYCYEGQNNVANINDDNMENEWWLYCNETNTKLLPKFHYILAYTFINNHSNYDNVLNDLKRKIGKRSDDGDAWVDMHSGEVICYIDLDTEEGYKDGFIDKSRSVLEKDAGEIMLENLTEKLISGKEKPAKRLSPEGEIVSNVISVLASNMGIDIETSRESIIRIVTELMNQPSTIEKESAYELRQQEAAKKGKKLPSYAAVYSSTILYLTLGMFLIGIQTSIPSIRTNKTAPGCVRSFSGFPLEGEGDNSALEYIACVAIKSRDASTIPWNMLPKNDAKTNAKDKIVATTKTFISKYLWIYPEVEQLVRNKTEYLLINVDTYIPLEHDLSKWVHFLPPLRRIRIPNNRIQTVSNGFTDSLHQELFSGDSRQYERMLVLHSKIYAFSLAIQESVQKIVEKKNMLLKASGNLYMDNACCNESRDLTTLEYFIQEDKNIEVYNNAVFGMSAILRDIRRITQSAIMLSNVNTKRSFPVLSNEFNEETIYRGFITLCKFHSVIPLDEERLAICTDKPNYLKKMETIQEKIEKLKRDGRNYTKEQFIRLFQIISRQNQINASVFQKRQSCVDKMKNLLVQMNENNDETIPSSLVQNLENIIDKYADTYSEDIPEMRRMKNYLQISIQTMRTELIEFLRPKLTNIELKKITKFISEISIWNFDKDVRNADIKISDDGLYNYINFIKNHIEMFTVIFPSMIVHSRIQKIDVPKYWGLSQVHVKDIQEMVNKYYDPLMKFYNDTAMNEVFLEIINKTRGMYLLSQNTPILTSIQTKDKEVYNVFDKRTVTLLHEYYLLSVFLDYVNLTKNPEIIARIRHANMGTAEEPAHGFSADFLIEKQLRFADQEDMGEGILQGDIAKLNDKVGKLIVSYVEIMMSAKKMFNVSHKDIEDRMFKLKEAEKYDFTDKLKDLTTESRAVDTMLKRYKLGPVYSLGMSKGIREYDADHFEHDKQIAENVAKIENIKRKRRTRGELVDEDDLQDELMAEQEIEKDLADSINMSEDYDDGDPYGEEYGNGNDDYE
jgi:hypothetical protein